LKSEDYHYYFACDLLLVVISTYDFMDSEIYSTVSVQTQENFFYQNDRLGGWLSDECDYVISLQDTGNTAIYYESEIIGDSLIYAWSNNLRKIAAIVHTAYSDSVQQVVLYATYLHSVVQAINEFEALCREPTIISTQYQQRFVEESRMFENVNEALRTHLRKNTFGNHDAAIKKLIQDEVAKFSGQWRQAVDTAANRFVG
jgi:hypothetical protein